MTDLALGDFGRSTIEMESGNISYIDVGLGTPIVLLHGAPMTSTGFIRVIDALKSKYRVIVPDLPGFGRSTASDDFDFSLRSYSGFVADFLRELDLRDMVLFVNDSSGCMGLHASAECAPRLLGIVVADTIPLPISGLATPVRWILRFVMGSAAMKYANRKLNLLAWMVATLAPMWRPFDREQRAEMIRQFDTDEKRNRILNIFEQMGRDCQFMQEAAIHVREHLVDKPTLLLYGQFDPMRFVGSVRRFRQVLKMSKVAIIPWEEHFPILGSGERVAKEMDAFIEGITVEK